MFYRYKCIDHSHLLSDFVNDFLFNLIFYYSLAVTEIQLILCILVLYPIIQLNSRMVFFIYYQIFYRQFCCLKIKTSLLLSHLYMSCLSSLPDCIGSSLQSCAQQNQWGHCPGGSVVENPLPAQDTRVQFLIREDPTCCGATKPLCRN